MLVKGKEIMERILEVWQHMLYVGFGDYPKSRRLLIVSLLVAIAGLGLMIYVLSLRPFLPGTIWKKRTAMKLTIVGKPEEINKLIKLINEGDDVIEDFKETKEIGFLAEKKPDDNRTSN